jgi:hypothetical protein
MQETQNARRGVRGWIQLRERVVEKTGGSENAFLLSHNGSKNEARENEAFSVGARLMFRQRMSTQKEVEL